MSDETIRSEITRITFPPMVAVPSRGVFDVLNGNSGHHSEFRRKADALETQFEGSS